MRGLPQNFVEWLRSRAPPVADTARRSRGRGRRAQAPFQGAQRNAGTATRKSKEGKHERQAPPVSGLSATADAAVGLRHGAAAPVRECCPF